MIGPMVHYSHGRFHDSEQETQSKPDEVPRRSVMARVLTLFLAGRVC